MAFLPFWVASPEGAPFLQGHILQAKGRRQENTRDSKAQGSPRTFLGEGPRGDPLVQVGDLPFLIKRPGGRDPPRTKLRKRTKKGGPALPWTSL